MKLLLLAAGGATGALLRYMVCGLTSRIYEGNMPLGTIIVNVVGCFIVGLLSGIFEEVIVSNTLKMMLFVGFLGAFTTFSAYSLESFNLFRDGQVRLALINILISNMAAIVMVFAGFFAAKYGMAFLK